MNEELGIDISNWNILEWWELVHSLPDYDVEYHRYLFLVNIPDDVTVFQDFEWAGAHFVPISELHALKFNTDIYREIEFLNNAIFK